MNSETVQRRATGYALMGAVFLSYFSRPWSCGHALSRFTPEDAVSYAHFDYHGWIVMFAWLMALIFAAPVFWLASKLFVGRTPSLRLFGRGPDTKTTYLSLLVALGLGAPMHSQISYLIALPLAVSAPVWASSLIWLVLVEAGRTAAVEGDLLSKGAVRVAALTAVLMTVPSLVLAGFAIVN